MKKERIAGIDIIKALATIFVISIHQIGMTHTLAMRLTGLRPFIIIFYRYAVMSCVPLFIMTTGYLQNKKTVSSKFYKGIIPILLSYLVSTLGIIWINASISDTPINVYKTIINTFNFTNNNYAWYVEMFIGLFLLIPFINKMYHAVETRNKKRILICILIFLTICPSMLFMFNNDKYYYDVFPDYWADFYPVTYYFIGAYFSEYKPKINKYLALLFVFCSTLMPTLIQFMVADGAPFTSNVFNGFNSLSALFISVAIFILFYDVNISVRPIKWLVCDISVATLEIYLWSNGVEKILYKILPEEFPMRLVIMILSVFVGAYILAKLQRSIFWIVKRIINLLKPYTGKHSK